MQRTWTVNDFPLGFEQIHPEPSINFQLNRLYHFSGDPVLLTQLRKAAPGIRDFTSLVAGLIPLAERAEEDGELLRAAMCYRGAAFVTPASDPHRHAWWRRFRDLSNAWYGIGPEVRHVIPFGGIDIPALRFLPEGRSRGTVVLMNGFDGYLEEFTRLMLVLCGAGFEVIAFDGPGQGEVLETSRAPMIPECERPTAAVLDHFGLDDVTVLGFSLGGGLAVRAAAFEPRIARVICCDVLPDLFGSLTGIAPAPVRELLRRMVPLGIGRRAVNSVMNRIAARDPLIAWGIQQGMLVMGAEDPFDFIRATLRFRTARYSHRLTQDVLLMAGTTDHYVPIQHLHDQIATLTGVRSLSARIFTPAESASNHCQVGNLGLAVRTVLNWLDQFAPVREE